MTTTDKTRDDDAPVRVGSVCTGSLMLDVAIEHTFGGRTVWCAETDPHASQLIARRRPGLDNLGDLAGIDWHQLAEPAPSTSSPADTVASLSRWQAAAAAPATTDTCGPTSPTDCPSCGRRWPSSKTSPAISPWDSTRCWPTSPTSTTGPAGPPCPPPRLEHLMDDRACSSSPPTHDRRVAVLRNGSWTEPDNGLFGPEPYTGTLPACGQMDHHTITTLPGPEPAAPTASTGSPLLPTPDHSQAARGGPSDPETRRAGGQTVSLEDVATHL